MTTLSTWWQVAAIRRQVRWWAFRDGIAHAVPARGRVVRSACGRALAGEAMTWPERSRCAQCLARLGLVPAGEDPKEIR